MKYLKMEDFKLIAEWAEILSNCQDIQWTAPDQKSLSRLENSPETLNHHNLEAFIMWGHIIAYRMPIFWKESYVKPYFRLHFELNNFFRERYYRKKEPRGILHQRLAAIPRTVL